MPFFRIDRELHYFAHVPKCAGASVEVYLRKRFGKIAFANSQFYNVPEAQRWTKSSPQHIDREALALRIERQPASRAGMLERFVFAIVAPDMDDLAHRTGPQAGPGMRGYAIHPTRAKIGQFFDRAIDTDA